MKKGTELHKEYSEPYKDWDRRLLRYQLSLLGPTFSKQVDNIIIRGAYDDLKVTVDPVTKEKRVSFIEVKTTAKGYLTAPELASAVFQLQLYVWLLKDHIKAPWVLDSKHYLEIYSQKDRTLLKRVEVLENITMEETIKEIIQVFKDGTGKRPPPIACKWCPGPVKDKCEWYKYERG